MKYLEHSAPQPGSAQARPGRSRVRAAAVGLSATALLFAAGCGTSEPAAVAGLSGVTASGQAAGAAGHGAHSRKAPASRGWRRVKVTNGLTRGAVETPRKAKVTVTRVQTAIAGTGGNTANDDNPKGIASRADSGGRPTTKGVANPCLLVTRQQAEKITGKTIKVTEAPLGPTCLYEEAGSETGSQTITLAVESQRFSELKPRIKKLSKFTIAGHAAYCGVYGEPILYMPLSTTRTFEVTGACGVATKFATIAIHKLV